MKNFFFVSILLIALLCSCKEESNKVMCGLQFGMTQSTTDTFLRNNNLSGINNDGFIILDNVHYLDFIWSFMRVNFTEDHLSETLYYAEYNDSITPKIFDILKQRVQAVSEGLKVSQNSDNEISLSDTTVVVTLKYDYISSNNNSGRQGHIELKYSEVPSAAEIARRAQIAKEREDDIDVKLQQLNEAMANYVKCLKSVHNLVTDTNKSWASFYKTIFLFIFALSS
jgi:hypothetical protein